MSADESRKGAWHVHCACGYHKRFPSGQRAAHSAYDAHLATCPKQGAKRSSLRPEGKCSANCALLRKERRPTVSDLERTYAFLGLVESSMRGRLAGELRGLAVVLIQDRPGVDHNMCDQGILQLQPEGPRAPADVAAAAGPHPLAGRTVRVGGAAFAVEDWWSRVRPDDQNPLTPKTPAFSLYVLRRSGDGKLPPPGVYGHFGDRGWILGQDEVEGAEVVS